MTNLSYSQITEHRRCAQSWMYKYHFGYERVSTFPSPERDFGSWWHALRALDAIQRGRRHETLRYAPPTIKTVDNGPIFDTDPDTPELVEVLAAAETWWNNQPLDYQDAFVGALGDTLPNRLISLNASWTARWADDLAIERPVAVEVRWERTLPNGTTLVGYIDEVYLDGKRRMLVVRDHKTHKALGLTTSIDDMMDSPVAVLRLGHQRPGEGVGHGSDSRHRPMTEFAPSHPRRPQSPRPAR